MSPAEQQQPGCELGRRMNFLRIRPNVTAAVIKGQKPSKGILTDYVVFVKVKVASISFSISDSLCFLIKMLMRTTSLGPFSLMNNRHRTEFFCSFCSYRHIIAGGFLMHSPGWKYKGEDAGECMSTACICPVAGSEKKASSAHTHSHSSSKNPMGIFADTFIHCLTCRCSGDFTRRQRKIRHACSGVSPLENVFQDSSACANEA